MTKTNRLLHLDVLRILAIYLVIFNHTGDRGYMLFAYRIDSPMYFLYMMCSVFCKIAVPLFFMISGALLIPRGESYRQLFMKRILRILIVLVVISIPYYIWLHRNNGISIVNFFIYIYGNSASTSLWYLYGYLGFLFTLPFLRSMVKGMQQKDYFYLFVGYVMMAGVLPSLEHCLAAGSMTIHESFQPIMFMSQSVFFGLMGYYIEHVLDSKYFSFYIGLIAMGLSVVALVATCAMTHWELMVNGVENLNTLEIFFNNFIAIPAITMYYFMKQFAGRIKNTKLHSIITLMGSAVFGVYLIEKIVRALTSPIYSVMNLMVGSFIATLIWCLVVLSFSLIIVVCMKHTPVIKKVVNKFI